MRYSRDDAGFDRVATIDIETTHYEPDRGEVVSVGLGVHERGTPGADAAYELLHRDGDGEAELIRRSLGTLESLDADGLVSYGGRGFDLRFLERRARLLGDSFEPPSLHASGTHVDLFEGRKEAASRRNRKWPKLEECVESYGVEPARTLWGDEELTNVRFGKELGPAYLRALDATDEDRVEALAAVIEHYLLTDLEANFAVYYGDLGEAFEPSYLGTTRAFEA